MKRGDIHKNVKRVFLGLSPSNRASPSAGLFFALKSQKTNGL